MKHLFIILFVLAISFFAKAQSIKIEIGNIDTINSKILNEKRAIWIYNPKKEAQSSSSKLRYPVIYLLDGDWHFVSVIGMLQHLSYTNGNTICPEMIVVGVPSNDRYRDLTPSRDSAYSVNSGGNEKFLSFIEKELIPYIDSAYPVEPYRMLIGHSLGGLTVMNALEDHSNLFNSYVAIDPSMWWDNQISLKETINSLSNHKFDNKSLFLAIANTMEEGMDTIVVRKDNSRNTLPIRSILELSDHLNSNIDTRLNFKVKYYKNENHGSIPHIATYDALHFIFNFYNLSLTKADYSDTTLTLPYKIENHYKNVSEKMGYNISPSENTIYVLAINSLYLKNYSLAEYFFKLNISNHPESFIAYDSFGDYYITLGNFKLANEMYRKALSIYDNIETREKLENIQKE
ncbi:MAG: prolyl oligopeptidase family serine peptidase [Prolixibacteraceae bacterium]|nr:prolyl oligopeptidase family serine peptidase [Prolixibacteraceae bacterium]